MSSVKIIYNWIYTVDKNHIEYLSEFESHVSYNKDEIGHRYIYSNKEEIYKRANKMYVAVAKHKTTENLELKKAFTVGFATKKTGEYLDKNGNIDVDKMEIITFDMVSNTYRVLGEVVGNAFKDGLKLED